MHTTEATTDNNQGSSPPPTPLPTVRSQRSPAIPTPTRSTVKSPLLHTHPGLPRFPPPGLQPSIVQHFNVQQYRHNSQPGHIAQPPPSNPSGQPQGTQQFNTQQYRHNAQPRHTQPPPSNSSGQPWLHPRVPANLGPPKGADLANQQGQDHTRTPPAS